MDKIELRAAQRFLDNNGVPQEKPKPPPRSWLVGYGPFVMPEGELDAKPSIQPPYPKTWPYDTYYLEEYLQSGHIIRRYCVKTEDNRWLELVNANIA